MAKKARTPISLKSQHVNPHFNNWNGIALIPTNLVLFLVEWTKTTVKLRCNFPSAAMF